MELQVLYDFIKSLLPSDVAAQALVYAPVVIALVGLCKRTAYVKERIRVLGPALSALFGLFFGFMTVNFDVSQYPLALGAGALITLAAIGGFSAAKNIRQSVQ